MAQLDNPVRNNHKIGDNSFGLGDGYFHGNGHG